MSIYSVMAPQGPETPTRAADRLVFLPDRFSFAAAALGPFWLAYTRNWRSLLIWVFCAAAIGSGILSGKMSPDTAIWTFWTSGLFLGMQAHVLAETALIRQGFRVVDIVTGQTQSEAERIFFRRYSAGDTEKHPIAYSPHSSDIHNEVLGLFPSQEGRV